MNNLIHGDCLTELPKLPSDAVNLIFADPPFNIGLGYDLCKDNKPYQEYVDWTEKWVDECARILSPTGSMYAAIGDEFAPELAIALKKRLHQRNWIVWYYSFGQSQKYKFARCHTHILYFTKSKNEFTFNSDAVRVTSARQKYGDKRASSKGKVPDDVWTDSRICGSFNERIGDHPCQMPLSILNRILLTSSNKGDYVLDPFAGTGTTLVSARDLGRNYIGIEMSASYIQIAESRLREPWGLLFQF